MVIVIVNYIWLCFPLLPYSGVHHKGKNCDPGTKVRQIQNLLTLNHDKLFPDGLTVAGNPRTPNRMPKPNGGWGDFRDRQLCASFATPEGHR